MNNNKKILGKVIYVITLLFLLVILYFAYEYYQSNNFNDFIRSEKNLYTSKFKRDKETKYSQKSSYKISSDEFNDAMFYKEVQVEKNQPYKIYGKNRKCNTTRTTGRNRSSNFYRGVNRKIDSDSRNKWMAKDRINF